MSNNDDFWQKQYELIATLLSDESDRFWTRFNIALIINGALVGAFGTISILSTTTNPIEIRFVGFIAIPIMGCLTSIFWYFIIQSGRGYQTRLLALGRKIEDEHSTNIPVKYFGDEFKDKLRGHVTYRAYSYPISFVFFWGIFSILIICKGDVFLK